MIGFAVLVMEIILAKKAIDDDEYADAGVACAMIVLDTLSTLSALKAGAFRD